MPLHQFLVIVTNIINNCVVLLEEEKEITNGGI